MLGYSTRLRIGAAGLALLGSSLLALAACQLIAGTESREANPFPPGCALPAGAGLPLVRFANFVPNADVVDVCIRPAGGSWGEPIILGGGSDCGNPKKNFFAGSALPTSKPATAGAFGIDYSQVTIPFAAPSATVDVKVIAAGGNCSATALTEADGLKLSTNAVTTLLRIGGNGVPQKIEALPEDARTPATGSDVRFVHAMPGVGPLDIGLAPSGITSLPTTNATPFLTKPISFGQAPAAGADTLEGQPVLANGYAPVLQGTFHLVASVDGSNPKDAVLLWNIQEQNGARYSLYMSGVTRDNVHPPRGFACDEASPPTPPIANNTNNNPNQNPLLETCVPTGLSGISVDVFNTSLYGPNSPDFPDRETAIQDPMLAVLSSPSDIMCLTELDFLGDIQTIVTNSGPVDSGMPGRFPYSYWAPTQVATPPTNNSTGNYALDINGNPPPMPTIPCQSVPSSLVDMTFSCMEQHCDTTNDATGTLPGSTDCLSGNCPGPFSQLLLNSTYNACFDCIIDYVASDQPYQVAQDACTTKQQTPYGFGGQLPNLILSRYPIIDQDYLVLPSSQYRQGVLWSRIQLEDQQLDFYCGFFTSTLVAQDLPYVGAYGNGGNPSTAQEGGAYANEQYLQALDLIKWVKQKSGDPGAQPCPPSTGGQDAGSGQNCVHPAVIVGDWRASIGVPDAGAQAPPLVTAPSSIVPGTVGTLAAAPGWTAVSAPGWTPQCTYCPQTDNPLNVSQTVGYFMTQPFLYAWGPNPKMSAPTAAQGEGLLYTTPTVQPGATSGFDAATLVPLSQYYGLNIQLVRPY